MRSDVRSRSLLWLDLAVKAALIGLLLLAVLRPDLRQFSDKAMAGRAIAYPFAALVVPAVWFLTGLRRRTSYPYAVDILVVLPFLIDMAGNAANLYDTISWWDDANHFVNWAILVTAFGLVLVRLDLSRSVTAGLAVGFGAVTAILWELLEYVTFIHNSTELETAYTDTLGDLVLGLCGSLLGAALTVTALWPRSRAR
jgi:glycopeptide antibiotics resistance protein